MKQNSHFTLQDTMARFFSELPSHNLPTRSVPLVGREDELGTIHQLLQKHRLVTLTGSGGVGKSRLALQAAWESLSLFHDGVYLVSVEAVSMPEFLVPTIADALGFSLYNPKSLKSQLLDYLRVKEILLLVDNFEHLLPETDLLTEILDYAPAVKLLVTSRECINLSEEQVFGVAGLRYPENKAVPETESYAAVQLFLQSARRVCADFSLANQDLVHIARICQLVEGLPLALELAGAWARALSCQDIAQEIERDLDFLVSTRRDQPERHHSMQTVFEQSWNLLPGQEKNVLCKMSVFRRGACKTATEYVTGATPRILLSLVDRSLLHWDAPSKRYRIHPLLGQYAGEKLALDPGTVERVRDQHAAHFAAFMKRHEERLGGREQVQTLSLVKAEIENIRLAWKWMVSRVQTEQIEQSLEGLHQFYHINSWFQEGKLAFAEAVDSLHKSGKRSKEIEHVSWKLRTRLGRFYNRFGDHGKAEALLQENLTSLRALGDSGETAFCLIVLADTAVQQGRYAEARQRGKQALAIYRQIGDERGIAKALQFLGGVAHMTSDYGKAERLLRQAAELARAKQLRQVEAASLRILSLVSATRGAYVEAQVYTEQALHIFYELNDRHGESMALMSLGVVLCETGDYSRARTFFERSLHIRRETGNRRGEGIVLGNLGLAAFKQGDFVRARRHLEQAVAIFRDIGDQGSEALGIAYLGLLSNCLADNQSAQEYGQRAFLIAEELGDRRLQAYALTCLGHAAKGLGELTRAAEYYRQALALRRDLGQDSLAMEPLAGLARISLARGQLVQAQTWVEEILSYLEQDSSSKGPGLLATDEPFRTYQTCYRVLQTSQDPRAAAVLEAAHNLLQERAAKISDEEMRRSFLEHVPSHREIVSEFTRAKCTAQLAEPLTNREMDVLRLIADGLTNREIAERLVIDVGTVKFHAHNIYGKLEVRNRTQAAARARELNLL